MRADALAEFCRIKRRVHAYLRLERRLPEGANRERAIWIALQGRIRDPLMAAQVYSGEEDIIWRRHIEAVVRVNGSPTADVVTLCQTWAAVFSIYQTIPAERRPASFDEFVREYYRKAQHGGTAPAEYAKILEEMNRLESIGDLVNGEALAERLVALAPFAAGSWHALGRIRRLR